MAKEIKYDAKAREAMLKGVQALADAGLKSQLRSHFVVMPAASASGLDRGRCLKSACCLGFCRKC